MELQKCFYCGKRSATLGTSCTLYKAVQLFSQEKLKYIEYRFNIDVCSDCYENAERKVKVESFFPWIALILSTCVFVIYYIVTNSSISDNIIIYIVLIPILSGILLAVFRVLYLIYALFTKTDTELKTLDHPFVKKMKKYDWHLEVPHPKYDSMPQGILSGDATDEEVYRQQEDYLKEARNLYMDYLGSLKTGQMELDRRTLSPIENKLSKIVNDLISDIGCKCFYQYSSVKNYDKDIVMKIQLPQLLQDMNLALQDILNYDNYFCTIAVMIDDNETISTEKKDIGTNLTEIEDILSYLVKTPVRSFGIIKRNEEEYRAIKFLFSQKNMEIQYIEDMVDKYINAKVKMKGYLNEDGWFSGYLKGNTMDELNAFIAFIAKKRNMVFEQADIRLVKKYPLTYNIFIKFDANWFKPKKKLFI